MKKNNHSNELGQVAEFVSKFNEQYPNIYLDCEPEDVAKWLAQPHWQMYKSNLALGIIDQKMYERFMLGMFADWLKANRTIWWK